MFSTIHPDRITCATCSKEPCAPTSTPPSPSPSARACSHREHTATATVAQAPQDAHPLLRPLPARQSWRLQPPPQLHASASGDGSSASSTHYHRRPPPPRRPLPLRLVLRVPRALKRAGGKHLKTQDQRTQPGWTALLERSASSAPFSSYMYKPR